MENKTKNSDKFNGFIEGKGFYIILAVCLCVIGASGYVLFFTAPTEPEYVVEIPKPTANVPAANNIPDVKVDIKKPSESAPTTAKNETSPAGKKVSKPTPIAVSERIYLPPIIGKVSKSFSNSELVYDKTMADYRTHNGVDIECENGSSVSCFSDGKVEKVYTDELMGTCVIISHDDGIKSVYKGLSKEVTLKIGSKIKAGDVIGASASSNLTETEEPPHVHFEVLKDGKYVDPFSLIK